MGQYSTSLDDGRVTFDRRLAETKAKDLVCGELVDPREAITATHKGHVYYFCSEPCRGRFLEDPEKYT